MNQATLQQFANDPIAFFDALVIPSAHRGDVPFSEVMADFQRDFFRAIAPSLLHLATGHVPATRSYWTERTKGASKDSDLACCLLWLLYFSSRPLTVQVGAADRDQADELRKAARDILRLNPWLAERVTIQNWNVTNKGTEARCEIIAADVAGSHGSRPDCLILNELSHVTKQEFAENLADNATKVPRGLTVIATNAGHVGTWQYRWREVARTSAKWFFHSWSEPAPWLDRSDIAEARLRNSTARFDRLWHGIWSSGGDALDLETIEAAVTEDGPPSSDDRCYGYVAGLDLGVKRDRSALCVVGRNGETGKYRLAACESWAPNPATKRVDLGEVERAVFDMHCQFNTQAILYDPHQAALMSERLIRAGVPMVEQPFVGHHLNAMASTLIEQFRSGNIALYDEPELVRDLGRLIIVERSYGLKLEAARDDTGHADKATAFTLALLGAVQRAANLGGGIIEILPLTG